MMNAKAMHKLYIANVAEKIKALKLRIADNKAKITNTIKILDDSKDFIDRYSTTTYDNIFKIIAIPNTNDRNKYISKVLISDFTDSSNGSLTSSFLQGVIKSLFKYTKIDSIFKGKLASLEAHKPTYSTYNSILKKYNNKAMWYVLNGYSRFTFGQWSSKIRIQYSNPDDIKSAKVSNYQTKLRKQEIIDRGGTPYAVTKRDKDNKVIEDNGGEKYLMYMTEGILFFHWIKSGCHIPNKQFYTFKETNHTSTIIQDGKYLSSTDLEKMIKDGRLDVEVIKDLPIGHHRKMLLLRKLNKEYYLKFNYDL